ncbi:hypothetical protein CIB48_g4009 [Xylaria polymorpha]|nr:hypothetical protein CIB48_g4009 [Xylaria polymorpha]
MNANPVVPQLPNGRNDPVVCVVCGGICKITPSAINLRYDKTPEWMQPILVQGTSQYLEWQMERPSTRRSYYKDAGELIKQIEVTTFLGGSQGMKLGSQTLPINTTDPLIRIPIHKACFEMADIFCNDQARYNIGFRSASGGAPSSIPELYEIWCKRAIASHPAGIMKTPILEANTYYGAPFYSAMADYYRSPPVDRFLAYPLVIQGVTDLVVNVHLQTMDGKQEHAGKELAGLLDRIQNMPQEIADYIIDSLEPFEKNPSPQLQPTRVLPPSWWKKRLFSGKLIPWLWDLQEEDVVRYRTETFYHHNPVAAAKDKEAGSYIFDETMWDWELLCRQLAQPSVMERGGVIQWGSAELWNRRRIWKLLDVARLGHVQFMKSGPSIP